MKDHAAFAVQLRAVLAEIETMLLSKNKAYGNSALEPVRIFSKADGIEQLKVRLDDKLSRLMRGEAAGEDVELDLIGYLLLLRVARGSEGNRQWAIGNSEKPSERVIADAELRARVRCRAGSAELPSEQEYERHLREVARTPRTDLQDAMWNGN